MFTQNSELLSFLRSWVPNTSSDSPDAASASSFTLSPCFGVVVVVVVVDGHDGDDARARPHTCALTYALVAIRYSVTSARRRSSLQSCGAVLVDCACLELLSVRKNFDFCGVEATPELPACHHVL